MHFASWRSHLLFVCSQEVADLEKRVQALEVGKQYDATKEAVQKVEQEFLIKFREIRSAMVADGSGGSSAAATKELEALKAENEELKRQNDKMKYRIQHMLTYMEEIFQKEKASALDDFINSKASF